MYTYTQIHTNIYTHAHVFTRPSCLLRSRPCFHSSLQLSNLQRASRSLLKQVAMYRTLADDGKRPDALDVSYYMLLVPKGGCMEGMARDRTLGGDPADYGKRMKR